MLGCCRAVQVDSTVCLDCAPLVYLSALSKYCVAVVLLMTQLWEFNKATIKLTCVSNVFVLFSTKIGVLCKLFSSWYAWLMPRWLNNELISEQLFRSSTIVLSLWGTDAKHTLVQASQMWGFYIFTSERELCSHPCQFVWLVGLSASSIHKTWMEDVS